MKSAKQLYLSIKQLQFNKEIMRQSYEIKRKAVIFFRGRRKPMADIKTRDTTGDGKINAKEFAHLSEEDY